MRFVAAILATFLLFIFNSVIAQSEEPPADLVIDVLEKPDACEGTAAAGDRISVHYVCFKGLQYIRCS